MTGDKLWTWEDIVHLPEHEQPEIVGGKPYYRAVPRARHGNTAGRLFARVAHTELWPVQTGWWICMEPAVRLSPYGIVGPDLAGWRKERLAELPDDWPLDIRPDWVCEVLSPGNGWYDRGPKAQAYAQAGIPWYWLVDPQQRTLEVLELHGSHWRLQGCYHGDDKLALPPFDDLEIAVDELFAPRTQVG
jgi:Uma2 family endonuclease